MDLERKFVTVTTLLIPVILEHERYRGSVLDREGRETPITDEMVLHACETLEHIKYPFRESFRDCPRS
jgi:hypothetical protein